jgi:hypothetical protein
MQIDIPIPVIEDLKELLTILSEAEKSHFILHDDEELIEPWTPSDSDEQISCPKLTVGFLRKAQKIKEMLRL